jgi:hypothetical protein
MIALRLTFVVTLLGCVFGDDDAALMQAVKPKLELSATTSDLNHNHVVVGKPESNSATTKEVNDFYDAIGDDALILFKFGDLHGRVVDLLEVTHQGQSLLEEREKLVPHSHQRKLKDIDPNYDSKMTDSKMTSRLTVAQLVDQYIGMAKNFPMQEIMEVMKPVLRKKDYEEYQEALDELSELKRVMTDKNLQEVLQRNVDGLKNLMFDKDLEKLLTTIRESTGKLPTEKDRTTKGKLMHVAGESTGTFVTKVSSILQKMSKDMTDQIDKTFKKFVTTRKEK